MPKSTDAYVEVTNFKTYGTDALASQAKGYYCGALPTVKIPANTKKLFYCEHKWRSQSSGLNTNQYYAADCYEITGLGL